MTSCMGGWCQKRALCLYYHSKANQSPIERLCEPRKTDAWQPIVLNLKQEARTNKVSKIGQTTLEAAKIVSANPGITLKQISEAIGIGQPAAASRLKKAVHEDLVHCKRIGNNQAFGWHPGKSDEAPDIRSDELHTLASRPNGMTSQDSTFSRSYVHRWLTSGAAAGKLFSVKDGHFNRYFADAQHAAEWQKRALARNRHVGTAVSGEGKKISGARFVGPEVIPDGVKRSYATSNRIDIRYQVESLDDSQRLFGSMSTGRKPEVRIA